MKVEDIPALGSIEAIPRKESPFDTECVASSAATALPASIKIYQNFTS